MEPFVLFVQHGWDDNNAKLVTLARQLVGPGDRLVAPSLNRLQTWLRIEPLIEAVEAIAREEAKRAPARPWRIIGHSMGGLIWLEVLARHPEWRSRVHSLICLGSPIGGSNRARWIDPFGWGIGIAGDLGRDRRILATTIAADVPVLSIAGDLGHGTDGTVPVGATQCEGACWTYLPGISHTQLRHRQECLPPIETFWQDPVRTPRPRDRLSALLRQLRALPGIVDTHRRGWEAAPVYREFNCGALQLRLQQTPLTLQVYLGDRVGICYFSGFAGLVDIPRCREALAAINEGIDEGSPELEG